jgi:hypothetical protein
MGSIPRSLHDVALTARCYINFMHVGGIYCAVGQLMIYSHKSWSHRKSSARTLLWPVGLHLVTFGAVPQQGKRLHARALPSLEPNKPLALDRRVRDERNDYMRA